ncbi:MAG TPA: DNA-3-methyladenine glycosylase I, partial [Alphaproteobacteria bacterium]|nr:DNA-3-methyladenine glycosylase I [Alphaproteobacteria bacterium]
MRTFDQIFAIAAKRHGGPQQLEKAIAEHKPKSRAVLAKVPDDRWLSTMTRCVFQAGFSWAVIEKKWNGFEAAFDKFDVKRCAMMTEKKIDALLKDTRIVRNARKIISVPKNAQLLLDLAKEHGSAAKFLADWPDTDYVGLLDFLKKHARGLGGGSAMYCLRRMGKPAFITSRDVVARLIDEGVIDKEPSGKAEMKKVQEAFNKWAEQSGRDLTSISRML